MCSNYPPTAQDPMEEGTINALDVVMEWNLDRPADSAFASANQSDGQVHTSSVNRTTLVSFPNVVHGLAGISDESPILMRLSEFLSENPPPQRRATILQFSGFLRILLRINPSFFFCQRSSLRAWRLF